MQEVVRHGRNIILPVVLLGAQAARRRLVTPKYHCFGRDFGALDGFIALQAFPGAVLAVGFHGVWLPWVTGYNVIRLYPGMGITWTWVNYLRFIT